MKVGHIQRCQVQLDSAFDSAFIQCFYTALPQRFDSAFTALLTALLQRFWYSAGQRFDSAFTALLTALLQRFIQRLDSAFDSAFTAFLTALLYSAAHSSQRIQQDSAGPHY